MRKYFLESMVTGYEPYVEMVAVVKAQAAALKRPPMTFEQVLSGLATVVPEFAALIKEHSDREDA